MAELQTIVNVSSLNYIGAKKTLLPFLDKVISQTLETTDVFCDLFAGSGIVGSFFRQKCRYVIANDIELYSYIINSGLITCDFTQRLSDIIDDINERILASATIEPDTSKDLVYKHFSPSPECERMFFTTENALRIDRCRQEIELLYLTNSVSKEEYHYLLGSLLVSADKLANTTSVYGAYLKSFKKTAQQTLTLKPLHRVINTTNSTLNKVINIDASLLEEFHLDDNIDIVYIDPPYCARQYGANYSPLNYIVRYDDDLQLSGKTGILKNYFKSDFASKTNVKDAFKNLVQSLNPNKAIFISYNSEGLLSQEEMTKILMERGDVILYKKVYKRYKSNSKTDGNSIFEFLFRVDCQHKSGTLREEIVE